MSLKIRRRKLWHEIAPHVEMRSKAKTAPIAMEKPAVSSQDWLRTVVEGVMAKLPQAWKRLQTHARSKQRTRKLRICESAQLGEKRFVALIQADGQRFLIGGTSNSVSLLATLPPSRKNFRSMLPKDLPVEAISK